ncbi:sugar transferase [Pseudidiomarina terrestris]|uniref:sugar transferase n=1 Tax=Pseudidiomarina terrestris TaxID=2820060 RepID=UPI00265B688D|nr:sugar transferase [Pseudidiomarina sp. 1APR75-33.1]
MKRTFDLLCSIICLLAFLPLLTMIYACSFIIMGSPVLHKQLRPGLNGKLFQMLKFRTMRDTLDSNGIHLPDSERITKLGAFLRKTSLDELPELWNVIKGDMSLVGPRPLLAEYLELYTPKEARRHEVRPGITGWAQVNGRNAISWEEKFKLDVWYVDNQSLWLDIKILLMTVKKVFAREGISADGHVTTEKFKGSQE